MVISILLDEDSGWLRSRGIWSLGRRHPAHHHPPHRALLGHPLHPHRQALRLALSTGHLCGALRGTVDPEFPSDPKMPIRAHPFQVRNDNNNIYFKKELVRSRMFVRFPVVEELRNSGFAIGTADPEFP